MVQSQHSLLGRLHVPKWIKNIILVLKTKSPLLNGSLTIVAITSIQFTYTIHLWKCNECQYYKSNNMNSFHEKDK